MFANFQNIAVVSFALHTKGSWQLHAYIFKILEKKQGDFILINVAWNILTWEASEEKNI